MAEDGVYATTELDPVELVERLERRVRSYDAPRALVALSGGVDSSVVLAVAARSLGTARVVAVTADSPSYPSGELAAAREVAASVGVAHRVVATTEVERDAYARNDGERCFHCKVELYTTLGRLAELRDTRDAGCVLLAGANADDLGDYRPGLRAGHQLGVRNPLLEEGLGKPAIRAAARRLGLRVADKPALACLSSRVAFGVRITPDLLARIDRAEQTVRVLGFDVVRVRHFGARASIEVPADDVGRLQGHRRLPATLAAIRGLGWEDVGVDPNGYRAGGMNATLVELGRGPALRRP
jgi:uncharacterized protein